MQYFVLGEMGVLLTDANITFAAASLVLMASPTRMWKSHVIGSSGSSHRKFAQVFLKMPSKDDANVLTFLSHKASNSVGTSTLCLSWSILIVVDGKRRTTCS